MIEEGLRIVGLDEDTWGLVTMHEVTTLSNPQRSQKCSTMLSNPQHPQNCPILLSRLQNLLPDAQLIFQQEGLSVREFGLFAGKKEYRLAKEKVYSTRMPV